MKFFLLISIFIFSSCSSKIAKRQVFKYQAEQTGKQYEYVYKASPKTDQKSLTSVSYSAFNSRHYFPEEESEHHEISIMHSLLTESGHLAFGAYYYKGLFDIEKTIFDDDYSEHLDYEGFGLRANLSSRFVIDDKNISVHFLNLQFGLDYENGDYLKWRKKLDKKYDGFVNENPSELTLSIHYVPEFEFHITDEIDIGFFLGAEKYFNKMASRSAFLYGYKIRVQSFGLSVITSEMDYDHIYYTSSPPNELKENEKNVDKYQQRIQFSFLF